MTKQEVIDELKTKLSETYTIRTTSYKDGKIVDTHDKTYSNVCLSFDREIIEEALKYLEEINKE